MTLGSCLFAAEAQTFSVYELNEFDRDSPAFLEFSRQTVNKVDPDTGAHVHALGDQVPFTNKVGSRCNHHLPRAYLYLVDTHSIPIKICPLCLVRGLKRSRKLRPHEHRK